MTSYISNLTCSTEAPRRHMTRISCHKRQRGAPLGPRRSRTRAAEHAPRHNLRQIAASGGVCRRLRCPSYSVDKRDEHHLLAGEQPSASCRSVRCRFADPYTAESRIMRTVLEAFFATHPVEERLQGGLRRSSMFAQPFGRSLPPSAERGRDQARSTDCVTSE